MIEQLRGRPERRVETRYPVDLDAKVCGKNQRSIKCRVRDICNGGVLLEAESEQPDLPFHPGDRVDLHFYVPDLPDALGSLELQAVIEVVHRVAHGLGGRFLSLSGDGRSRLARFLVAKAETIRTVNLQRQTTPEGVRACEILTSVGEQRLGKLLDSLLDTLIEELWSHVERAGSDTERVRLSGEILLLVRAVHNDGFSERLRESLVSSLTGMGKGSDAEDVRPRAPVSEAESEDLRLVEREELEVWLAKSELVRRLEEDLHEPLQALRTLVTALFHNTNLPLEPLVLAEAIEGAFNDLNLGAQLQCVALRLVRSHLSRNLGALYREILRGWSSAGLFDLHLGEAVGARIGGLTDAAARKAALPSDARLDGVGRALEPGRAEPRAASEKALEEVRASSRTAGLMLDILGRYEPQPQYPGYGRGAVSYVTGQQVADMLASLSSVDDQPLGAGRARPLRELVQEWLIAAHEQSEGQAKGSAPIMAPQVGERVEVIDRLLSLMLADPSAPERVKSVLRPLTRHFLSMALTESGELADTRLPLIKLINRLEQLAEYLQGDESSDGRFRSEYEEIIQRLVSVETGDGAEIDEIYKDVEGLESRVRREYKSNVSNWIGVCESKERARLAREEVRNRLNEAFTGKRVHTVILELLGVGWRSLLGHLCASSGIEAPRWVGYWEVLIGLYQATRQDSAEVEPMARPLIDDLLEKARSGLAYVGCDPVVGEELIERVENAVRRARASLTCAEDYVTFVPLRPDSDSEPDKIPTSIQDADWEKALEDVDALCLGSLVWVRGNETSQALRLIWRSEAGSMLALTDTMGNKVRVLRRSRLAEAFARGQAKAQAPTGKRMATRAADAAFSEMQKHLEYHETNDALTGLASHRRLLGSLTQLLLLDEGSRGLHVLGVLELDRYDNLTGAYGLSVGEHALRAVARMLEDLVPSAICLAAMGGGRFGLLMPVTDVDHALELGERIRGGLTVMPSDLEGQPFRISGSLGIALVDGDKLSPERVISSASMACLAAQREGGDRVVVFSEDSQIISRQLDLMRGWAQAEDVIKSKRHRLRYQRIVPIEHANGLSPHCEILLSVYDEHGAPLPLQSFLAAAEAFNMMREVDRQVIEAAFRWIQSDPRRVRALGGVAINLSGQSLSNADLPRYIEKSLHAFDVPVDFVSFEVTETAAIVNIDQAAIMLEDIKSLGCKVALDDFGTGMSSYSYLKRLPVDYVKIDGSFVKDILTSPQDREIVESFNRIAHFMGKKTVAEYVENQEILEVLRHIGVDFAQGYAVEKPQLIEELGRND